MLCMYTFKALRSGIGLSVIVTVTLTSHTYVFHACNTNNKVCIQAAEWTLKLVGK